MSTRSNYNKGIYEQLEQVLIKLDKMILENKKQSQTIQELKEMVSKLEEEKRALILEIERLKNNNNKNSSNSSKPSSTNGYKKVVLNNREKSNKKQGGQLNHQGTTLTKEDIEEMIKNGEIDEIETVVDNKNETNKHLKPIIKYEYDIKIIRKVIRHIIYPTEQTNIDGSPVYYGNNLKSIVNVLSMKYLSIDGITEFVYEITNGKINLSKGTIYEWNKNISENLNETEYKKIKEKLLNSLVLHVDETPIKINGKQYYIHNISNEKYTLQYVGKTRGKITVDEFGFLKDFKGILVHDHFMMYFGYGIDNAECNVHILRYLKGIEEYTNHKWGTKMKNFLLNAKEYKEGIIVSGCNKISDDEYNKFKTEYLSILNEGHEEYLSDRKLNAYAKEEINLINRMKEYVHNHLLFLEKFYVPFSNNRAESDLRSTKIRQKIGKFRSEDGAKNYVVTKSCFSTYKKNKVNVFDAISSLLDNRPVLI